MTALISRYPAFYAGSPEFVDIQNALDPEVQRMWASSDGVQDQLCVDTATWGLKYWEQTLGIPVELEKDLEYRRSRVRAKLRGAGTTTVALIKSVSESYSNGAVDVIEHPEKYALDIKFIGTIGVPPNLSDLTASLREIMPAHIHWEYIILYNTWEAASKHTWTELASRTWGKLREEKF